MVEAKTSGRKAANMSNRESSVQELKQAGTECVWAFYPRNLRGSISVICQDRCEIEIGLGMISTNT